MRVGVYAGKWDANVGGAFSYVESVFQGLMKQKNNHTYYVFYDGKNEITNTQFVKFISLTNSVDSSIKKHENWGLKNKIKQMFKKIPILKNIYFEINQLKEQNLELLNSIREQNKLFNYDNILNYRAVEYKIEMMWFITLSYIPVQCPFIYTIWDLAHLILPYFPEVNYTGWSWESREKLYSNVLKKATFIIVGTIEGKNQVEYFYKVSADKIKVIPFTPKSFQSNQNKVKQILQYPYIFYPAQFWPHKNHIVILSALKLLKEKNNLKIKCIFTGSDQGNAQFVRKMVSEFDIGELVEFKGFVENDTLKNLYENAIALVFPSFFGPDNIPPIEAFSLRCPVIASDIPGAREQLKDAALFFNPTDEEQLAKHIKLLNDDSILRNNLVEKGLSLIKTYTNENYFLEINHIFEDFSKIRRCWDSDNQYIHL